MKALALSPILCLTCAILLAAAQPPHPATLLARKGGPPLPLVVEAREVRIEGAFVLVILAYHNPTATPLSIGLQPWGNATTRLGDDVHNSYTLLQTFGIGYGAARRDWLGLEAHGHATVALLFRVEAPVDTIATRYTLTSGQQLIVGDTPTADRFTVALRDLTPG
jgi:hypothetical protein